MSESAGAGTISSAAQTPSTNAPQAQPSPAPQAFPERVRVKVEGREMEVPFDQLVKDYQLREASNRRFQQASEMAKKAGPILEALEKGDLKKLMSSVPKDQFRQFAEDYLIGELEYENLPDYEKRRIQAEMRAQELEAELNSERESKNKDKASRELAAAGAQVDQEIGDILQKMGKKPTPYLVAAIVDEMLASLDGKGAPISGEQAYSKGKARLDHQTEAYIADLSDQEFIAKLPPARIEAIRKHLLSQMKTPTSRQQAKEAPALKREDQKPMSIDEAFAARERQLKNLRRKA